MYKKQNNNLTYLFIALVVMGLSPLATFAGGPLLMASAARRVPFRYPVAAPVNVYTDLGNLGIIQNARANQLVANTVAQWSGVPTSSFRAQVAGDFAGLGLPDITATNANLVIGAFNGGGIQVIYDTDGFIIANVLGASRFGTLGIATPEFTVPGTDRITESWVVINGFTVNAADGQGDRYNGVITHEFGHAINLAHSQTSGNVISSLEQPGPGTCAPLPYSTTSFVTDIETMFPFINVGTTVSSTGAAMATIDRTDDRSAVSDLYPAANWPAVAGSITGKVRLNSGTEATAYNIVARNINNPFGDSNSAISGDRTRGELGPDGSFRINGLTPGAQYVVYQDGIFRGGFPTGLPFLQGPEEFFNGPNESGNGETDPPCNYTPLTATAGVAQDASITFNKVNGAPEFTQIGIGILASDVSDDGNIVVGSGTGGPPGFRWTAETGAVSLGGSGGNTTTISGDGTLITGNAPDTAGIVRASRWVSGTTWEPFPAPAGAAPCGTDGSSNWGASRNGSSGLYYIGGCAGPRAYFWNRATNTTTIMGFPSPVTGGGQQARTNGMSDDGRVLAGWIVCSGNPICRGGRQGVIWDSTTGAFTDFSTLFGAFVGEAYAANSNGSIVSGLNATMGADRVGWIWRRDGGFTLIPNLAATGVTGGAVIGISEDGNVAVGSSTGFQLFIPAIWTPETSNLNLESFVRAQGTDFFEWASLRTPQAITPDGTTIVGLGIGPPGTNFGAYRLQMRTAIVCYNNGAGARTLRVGFPQPFRQYAAHGATVGLCPASITIEDDPGFFNAKQ